MELDNVLETLKTDRDAAWAAFNPKAPSSRSNDWATFAQANAKWISTYFKHYGGYPPEDEIERRATDCYAQRRYPPKPQERSVDVMKTDQERDKGNARRRVGVGS